MALFIYSVGKSRLCMQLLERAVRCIITHKPYKSDITIYLFL